MSEKRFYDRSGRLSGTYQQLSNGDIKLYDADGVLVGTYDARQDKTYDSNGVYVGSGNQLAMLSR